MTASRPSARLRTCVLALALLGTVLAQEPSRPLAVDPAALAALVDRVLARQVEALALPGAVVAVAVGGEIVHAAGFGVADVVTGRAMDPYRTLVRTGSAGKPVTWAAVLQLVEGGLLDLHADVGTYLDFELPEGPGGPITMAHLLTHTPGFEDVGEDLFVRSADAMADLRTYLVDRMPRRVYAPGAVQAYSNYGTALAGYVVERITGTPFDEHVRAHVLEPAGMTRSTLRQPVPEPLAGDLAVAYGVHAGGLVPAPFEYATPYPAGGMSATAVDMARFGAAVLAAPDGGGGPLGPEGARLMRTSAFAPDPRLDGVTYGFMERATGASRVLFHDGDTFSFSSGLYLVPDAELAVFVAYTGPDGPAARRELYGAVRDGFLGGPRVVTARAAVHAAARERAGTYHLARAEHSGMGKVLTPFLAATVRVEGDGALAVTFDDETVRFAPAAPDLYVTADGSLLAFHDDEHGRAWMSFSGGPPFDAFNATSAYRAAPLETLGALAGTLAGTVVLSLVFAVGFGVAGLRRRRTRVGRGAGNGDRRRRVVALATAGLALATAAFVVSFVSLLTDLDPAFGVPNVLLDGLPRLSAVLVLPWAVVTAAAVLVGAVAAGARPGSPRLGLPARLLELALAAVAVAVVATLAWWNLLQRPW